MSRSMGFLSLSRPDVRPVRANGVVRLLTEDFSQAPTCPVCPPHPHYPSGFRGETPSPHPSHVALRQTSKNRPKSPSSPPSLAPTSRSPHQPFPPRLRTSGRSVAVGSGHSVSPPRSRGGGAFADDVWRALMHARTSGTRADRAKTCPRSRPTIHLAQRERTEGDNCFVVECRAGNGGGVVAEAWTGASADGLRELRLLRA